MSYLQESNTTAKFRVYQGSVQTLTNSATWYTLEIDTESYDPGSDYDPTTNYDYTVPVTGYYFVFYKVQFTNPADSDQLYTRLLKNSATNLARQDLEAGAGANTIQYAAVHYLTAADTIEVQAQNATSAGKSVGNGSTATEFGAHLLST